MFEVADDLGINRRPQSGALTPDARYDVRTAARPLDRMPRRYPGHKRWILLKFMIAMFMALTGAAAFNILTGTPLTSGLAWSKPGLDSWARATGFGIDTVVLTGHKFTADSDIFDALDLPNARSLASFDTGGVRRRLERLPWIESAEVTRVYPDRLDLRVRERRAFAVWKRGDQTELIDRSGRVLTAVNRTEGLGLPSVAGDGAASTAQALLSEIERYPDLKDKLDFAERVGQRRWTLHLKGGVTVHLPADGEAALLPSLAKGGRMAVVVDAGHSIIDLRAPGRTAVRPAQPRAGES